MIGGRVRKNAEGKYVINGKTYDEYVASSDKEGRKGIHEKRRKVYHGVAYKTSYGKDALTKKDLIKNKNGEIVSKTKSEKAKREKRLQKHGWTAKKGKFGAVRISAQKGGKRTRKHRR